MPKEPSKADVGVIVGRFHVHELHPEHKELVDYVCRQHSRVIVFLGVHPFKNFLESPLDFRSRKQMFAEEYPNVDVFAIDDCRSDKTWSKNLDREIRRWVPPRQSVCLYGSRDSFIPHYKGGFPTYALVPTALFSATEVRKEIARFYPPSKDYRAGLIAAPAQRYPAVIPTVDVAIFNEDGSKILLGKKKDEEAYRFIGGFVEQRHASLEGTVRAEVDEETHLEVGDIKFVGSLLVDDWRTRNSSDKILTSLFTAKKVFGSEKADDDIEEIRWFYISQLTPETFVPEHRSLFEMLRKHIS